MIRDLVPAEVPCAPANPVARTDAHAGRGRLPPERHRHRADMKPGGTATVLLMPRANPYRIPPMQTAPVVSFVHAFQ
jgi:hypothetical protein